MAAQKYKLMYWNSRGRAEPARMLFTLAGREFEDYRFKEGEWAEIKGDKNRFPLGQAPVLIIDDQRAIPQSKAIQRYIANEFGLYGANNCERACIDVVCETVDDIVSKLIPVHFEKDEAKKKELLEKFKESSKGFLDFLNCEIKKAGGKFFVGGKESLADVSVFWMWEFLYPKIVPSAATDYPDLDKFYKGISDDSKLSKYLKERPESVN